MDAPTPQPLPLLRQSMAHHRYMVPRSLPGPSERKYYSYLKYEAEDSYANATKVFPDYFGGDQCICAVEVTPIVHQHILESILGRYIIPTSQERFEIERRYSLGDYVGKLIRYSPDPVIEDMPQCMFTPMAYKNYDTAMYEACILSTDSIRTSLRHILYSLTPPPYNYDIELKVDLICTRGILELPREDHFGSDHELESPPHLVE